MKCYQPPNVGFAITPNSAQGFCALPKAIALREWYELSRWAIFRKNGQIGSLSR